MPRESNEGYYNLNGDDDGNNINLQDLSPQAPNHHQQPQPTFTFPTMPDGSDITFFNNYPSIHSPNPNLNFTPAANIPVATENIQPAFQNEQLLPPPPLPSSSSQNYRPNNRDNYGNYRHVDIPETSISSIDSSNIFQTNNNNPNAINSFNQVLQNTNNLLDGWFPESIPSSDKPTVKLSSSGRPTKLSSSSGSSQIYAQRISSLKDYLQQSQQYSRQNSQQQPQQQPQQQQEERYAEFSAPYSLSYDRNQTQTHDQDQTQNQDQDQDQNQYQEQSQNLLTPQTITSPSSIPPTNDIHSPHSPHEEEGEQEESHLLSSSYPPEGQNITPRVSFNSYDAIPEDGSYMFDDLTQDQSGQSQAFLTGGSMTPYIDEITAYYHDDLDSHPNEITRATRKRSSQYIRLTGKSLFIFSETNKFRLFLASIVSNIYFKDFHKILILTHIIFLTIMTSPVSPIFSVEELDKSDSFMSLFYSPLYNWAFFGIFILYTFRVVAIIIAHGLVLRGTGPYRIFNPSAYYASLLDKGPIHMKLTNHGDHTHMTYLPDVQKEKRFLHSPWKILDFISVLSYWLVFFLQINDTLFKHNLFVFRALTSLCLLRTMKITSQTTLILHAFRAGYKRVLTIFLFIGFFLSLFAIIGQQSFSGSLARTCLWTNPDNSSETYSTDQFCGSYIDANSFERVPYITSFDEHFTTPKGFTCPIYSVCQTQNNPYNGTINFDNFFNSFELAFVIFSLNTFSDIMYHVIDSERLVASIFFIVGVIILAYGLASLFISVVASTFQNVKNLKDQVAKEGGNEGIFTIIIESIRHFLKHFFINNSSDFQGVVLTHSAAGQVFYYLREIPLLVIFADLIFQCTVTVHTSPDTLHKLYLWEIAVAAFLGAEIILRFALYLPRNWLDFWLMKINVFDFVLAIVNGIILIPAIATTEKYKWLTCFQIIRIYRIVNEISFSRDIWLKILDQFHLIFDITIFYYLMVFLASLFACLLLQGNIPEGGDSLFNFQSLSNAFLAMYIISTTENWTSIMYNAIQFADSLFYRICIAVFLVLWLIASNYVTLNMFIAVITDNLGYSDIKKKFLQLCIFLEEEKYSTVYTPQIKLQLINNFSKQIMEYITSSLAENESKNILLILEITLALCEESKDTGISSDTFELLQEIQVRKIKIYK